MRSSATEIWVALETLALNLAAPNINGPWFERIERALVAGEQAQTITEWEQANQAFHRELATPARFRGFFP